MNWDPVMARMWQCRAVEPLGENPAGLRTQLMNVRLPRQLVLKLLQALRWMPGPVQL